MKKSFSVLAVILVLVVLFGVWGVGTYNSLVKENEAIDAQWSQVMNQLQRRSDLIPNLVATVKGYAAHEESVFTAIANARAKLNGAATPDEQARAAGEFESAVARLLVIVENYPQLKANEQFKGLMDELSGTENRISIERMRYNDAVKQYNTHVRQFPTVLIARLAGFGSRAYFEVSPGAGEVPKVDFSK